MPRSGFYYTQPQMTLEGIEVAIAMKQIMIMNDAEGRNQRINRLAHDDTAALERSKILRCSDCDGSSSYCHIAANPAPDARDGSPGPSGSPAGSRPKSGRRATASERPTGGPANQFRLLPAR